MSAPEGFPGPESDPRGQIWFAPPGSEVLEPTDGTGVRGPHDLVGFPVGELRRLISGRDDEQIMYVMHSEPAADEQPPIPYHDGALTIYPESQAVTVDGQPIPLTAQGYDIFTYLAHRAGKVATYRQILDHCWDPPWPVEDTNLVAVNISKVRRALGRFRPSIVTVRKRGYMFDPRIEPEPLPDAE